MFGRVLVANRGEIAVRVIRALHELGSEAVAVYSTADEDALHVRLADRAVRIGPPPAAQSYLSMAAIIGAAATTGCEAVHPGYGFLAENAEFVRACEDNELVFVGPPADLMERMGDKTQAKAEMRAAGVPLVPGTEGAASHVEIQVVCDGHGGVLTCGERECSIQRRHQKLIEESPSPALDAELREEMEAAAERACLHIGYRNAGTFEFLVGPDGSFSFIELNARLQVEHPVTEVVTQLDIVRLQLAVAAGDRLPLTGRAPRSGHAIEIRVNAEDPSRGFAPAPGRLTRFRAPLGPGVRVDTFVEDGSVIPPHYDSLIAKVIVRDESRDLCIERARRALRELDVQGVPTTCEAAFEILGSDEFRSGEYSTSFIEEAGARLPALAGA
jgi:acetyl/propionyl-CoA carboxylase alpha subunit